MSTEQETSVGQGIDCMNRFGIFSECQNCGGKLSAEHAHYRCTACGWRDSCCD